MATITKTVKVGSDDASGNAPYVVTVVPDDGDPGHGEVRDLLGHSAPWDSPTGAPVDASISGRPPFVATQDAARGGGPQRGRQHQ